MVLSNFLGRAMSELFAITMPVLPGQEERWKAFMEKIEGEEREAFINLRTEIGVRERTFKQQTPMGMIVIVTLEGENPAGKILEAFKQDTPHLNWFREEVKAIHGIDFMEPFDAPMPELIADSGM